MYRTHFNMQEASQKRENTLHKSENETATFNRPVDRRKIIMSRIKRRILKHVWLVRLAILTSILSIIFLVGLFLLRAINDTNAGYYASLVKDFLLLPPDKVKTHGNNTNILILGKGGEGHEAPELTDTIIFATISHTQPRMSLISLPRDIWLTDLRAKLNSVYYWGNKKEPGGGLVLAKASVEELVDQPVHYAFVVDFSGFKKVIDAVGGIEVDVQNSFTDNKYPVSGRQNDLCEGDPEYKCRYETISFEKGRRFMDGETALKFVRSRNAEGDEGTDLARAARQDKVIEALKNKVLSREILFSPKKLFELKSLVEDLIETDMDTSAAAILARRGISARDNLHSQVLPESLLENPPKLPQYDNLYVFVPKEVDPTDTKLRSWSKIQEWVRCVIENGDCLN